MGISQKKPQLNTTGRIAGQLGVAQHRVNYVILTRGIPPAAYAGRVRLFDRDAVSRIQKALQAIGGRGLEYGSEVDSD